MNLPKAPLSILTTLKESGHSSFIVGGCVRDSLMGITPKDWDIATSATPAEVKAAFPHTVDTGIAHGTVTVVINRCNYEVTTFRIDGEYLDGRRPEDVTFTTDLECDLSRRDFTMNAIAFSPETGIVDPFGGENDIRKKSIRCVGEPAARFTEDALRMMRAIRFSAQLGFSIDPDTFAAIFPIAKRLQMVSAERIRDELTKTLAGKNPSALPLLEDTKLLQFTCDLHQASKWLKALKVKEPAMLYAMLLADEDFMRGLKFDNRTIKETALYIRWLPKEISTRYDVKVALNDLGPQLFKNLIILKKIIGPPPIGLQEICDDILAKGECFTLKDLAISGSDLLALGLTGESVGRSLAAMLDKVMHDPSLNQKEEIIRLVSLSRL